MQYLYLRICKDSFGLMVTDKEIMYHATESRRYMYIARQIILRPGMWKGGEKMDHNRGLGIVEIILILTVLIIFILKLKKELIWLVELLCRKL